MTPQEKRQPYEVFIRAGKNAFLLGVTSVSDGPHKEQPYKNLWEKGYRAQKKQAEQRYYKKATWK